MQESLILVKPAKFAEAELIDGGKKSRFISQALLDRKEIVRTYSTDWEEARKMAIK